ncbi:MAG: Shedu anti-phage system protein SduA domain-containing protein [Candidatus Heimdallarchaeota archaeon]
MLKEEILKVLAENSEREITKFLKTHPEIVVWGFCRTGGNSKYVLNEFPLGSKYRADFVIPFGYSGAWEVHFIELKSPSDSIFTKNGRPSKSFNSAISRINDWRDFIERNRSIVQQDLSDWCIKSDLLNWHMREFPLSNGTSDYLHDINTFILFRYHIIIGRRKNITKDDRRRMNQYLNHGCSNSLEMSVSKT